MNRALATSLTTATFLIITISGIMMFFHFYDRPVKELHEYLGLAFVAAVIFHLFYNWKSMKSYFNKKSFYASLIAGAIVSAIFVISNQTEGKHPKGVVFDAVFFAPTAQSYALLKVKDASLKLKSAGLEVIEGETIMGIAKANKTSPFRIISILTQ